MKILTLNTWQERGPWQERWEVALKGVERFQPDLVAFQELFNRSWAQEIQKRMGFNGLLFPEEYCGLAIYADYPATSWGVTKLTSSSLEEYSRYALWAELKVEGKQLVIFNTHLSWKLEDGVSRKQQAEDLVRLIEEKAPQDETLLMGDLNAPPDSPEIRGLIRAGKMRDLFDELHPKEKAFTWDNRNPYAAESFHKMPDRRIDFILARGSGPLLKDIVSCDLVFTEPNTRGVWASDHFGVLAEFK